MCLICIKKSAITSGTTQYVPTLHPWKEASSDDRGNGGPLKMIELIDQCHKRSEKLVFGCDTNAHHTSFFYVTLCPRASKSS